jgi:hypothetical protein
MNFSDLRVVFFEPPKGLLNCLDFGFGIFEISITKLGFSGLRNLPSNCSKNLTISLQKHYELVLILLLIMKSFFTKENLF